MEKQSTMVNKDSRKCKVYSGANFHQRFKMNQSNCFGVDHKLRHSLEWEGSVL